MYFIWSRKYWLTKCLRKVHYLSTLKSFLYHHYLQISILIWWPDNIGPVFLDGNNWLKLGGSCRFLLKRTHLTVYSGLPQIPSSSLCLKYCTHLSKPQKTFEYGATFLTKPSPGRDWCQVSIALYKSWNSKSLLATVNPGIPEQAIQRPFLWGAWRKLPFSYFADDSVLEEIYTTR